jgi:putative ABC transport system permease protein
MLHNPITAASRDISRDWFYSGIMILGLAAGFAAAMLIGLYVHNEYNFESFIPGYDQVYRLETDRLGLGGEPQRSGFSLSTAAAQLALDFPEVEQVVRLALSSQWVGTDNAETWERVAWVEPDFFDVLPFPVLAGDAIDAMHQPDSIVLTRAMARKYFGQDAPIGETLFVQHVAGDPSSDPRVYPMVVRAVLEDPGDTHMEQFKIFAAGLAAWSNLTEFDQRPGDEVVWTYLTLRSGALTDDIRAGLPEFASRHYPPEFSFRLEAIENVHLTDDVRAVNAGIAAVGVLIVVVAAINFVMLITARGTRRAVEVGVRKTLGARRRELILLFIGEALIYVFVALLFSVAIVKLALPPINVFLQRAITLDPFSDTALGAAIAGAALLIGLISALYPAVVLSGVRPASALKGSNGRLMGSTQVRQALVIVQFGILTVLIIVAATIGRQTAFLLDNIDRRSLDQVLDLVEPCESVFTRELKLTSGVSDVACVSGAVLSTFQPTTTVRDPVQETLAIGRAAIDIGFFEMHGLRPVAGRFFSEDRGQDMVLDNPDAGPEAQPTVVLNESGARLLGFESPEAAVGRTLDWLRPQSVSPGNPPLFRSSEIVGVVPDFRVLGTLRDAIGPTLYYVDRPSTDFVLAKLKESRIAETLRSIKDLWRRTGHVHPMYVEFLGDVVRLGERDVIVQVPIIAASTGLAILIACLGLFAQIVFTTERQTKEIGVRKVMGASSVQVVQLLLWRFTKPVLWANLIAWPLAFWAASQWLEGFAYRVSLPFWLFVAASTSALLLAWATIGTKTWIAAHARPATAIRHE